MSPSRYYPVDFEPPGLRVAVSEGTSLLEAALRAGIRLWSGCGGQGTCGQCCIVVVEGRLSEVTEDELENLTPAELHSHCRLACNARVYSAVKVQIPKSSFATKRASIHE